MNIAVAALGWLLVAILLVLRWRLAREVAELKHDLFRCMDNLNAELNAVETPNDGSIPSDD